MFKNYVIGLSLIIMVILFSGCGTKKNDETIYYKVHFATENGESLNEVNVVEGELLTKINPPEKEGYDFVGWYLNDEPFDFNMKVTGDLTLIARWEKVKEEKVYYKVLFNNDDGTVIDTQDIEENQNVVKPNDPKKEGYNFTGWYLNDSLFDFNNKITSDLTLVAKWEKVEVNKNYYTVSFNSDGGTFISNQVVEENGYISKPNNPTKEGYNFTGWYLNNELFNFYAKVTTDLNLVAKWNKIEENKNYYTVSFNSDGGTTISKQVIEENKYISKPNTPTKEGYNFIGWYLNDRLFDFNTKVTNNLILTARWSKIEEKKNYYTVSFNNDDGTVIANQIIEENKSINKPNNPTKDGYNFVGWYLNDNLFDFNMKVTSNLTLVAKWDEILTEKIIEATEDIEYTTKKVNEINMLRGESIVVQEGVLGKKKVLYNVVYNSRGEEVSKTKQSEEIITDPIDQILKVGISDYNINTDIFTSSGGDYCLEEDLLVVDGVRVPSCTKEPILVTSIYIKDKTYTYIPNGSSYINITNNVTFYDNSLKMIYDGKTYMNAGGFGGGGPQSLTDDICNRYGLACGRW